MEKDALALLLLLGSLLVALFGLIAFVRGSNRRAQLAARGRADSGGGAFRAMLEDLDRRLRRTKSGQRLAQWLKSSGGELAPVDFLAICIVGGLMMSILLTLMLPRLVALVVGYALVIFAARAWFERRRRQRREAFINQLPDVARTLSNGTQAGLSIAGAVQMAARELDEPAGAEMANVVQEMRLGQPLDRALERLQERLPSREVAVLMTTIIIQQRAGGDTVRALQELGGTLEARKDLLREIRTVLSGSVFTSYVVAGIGIGTILLMNVISPGILREMTTSVAGLAALSIAGVLWAIAFVLIRAATRVEA
jgi:tight adherence protein B